MPDPHENPKTGMPHNRLKVDEKKELELREAMPLRSQAATGRGSVLVLESDQSSVRHVSLRHYSARFS